MARLNLQFHEAIAKAGRIEFLVDLMAMVHDRVRRFRGTTFADPAARTRPSSSTS